MLEEFALELFARAEKVTLDGSFGQVHHPGYFSVAHFLGMEKRDNRPVERGQPVDFILNPNRRFIRLEFGIWKDSVRRDVIPRHGFGRPVIKQRNPFFLQMVDARVIGDLCDPRRELALKSKLLKIVVDLEEDILTQVFPIAGIGNHPEDDVAHQPLGPLNQLSESIFIPRPNTHDETLECGCCVFHKLLH